MKTITVDIKEEVGAIVGIANVISASYNTLANQFLIKVTSYDLAEIIAAIHRKDPREKLITITEKPDFIQVLITY